VQSWILLAFGHSKHGGGATFDACVRF